MDKPCVDCTVSSESHDPFLEDLHTFKAGWSEQPIPFDSISLLLERCSSPSSPEHVAEKNIVQMQQLGLRFLMAALKRRDQELNRITATCHKHFHSWENVQEEMVTLKQRMLYLEDEVLKRDNVIETVTNCLNNVQEREQTINSEMSSIQHKLQELIRTEQHYHQQLEEEELSEPTSRFTFVPTSLRETESCINYFPTCDSKLFQEMEQLKSRLKKCEEEKKQLKDEVQNRDKMMEAMTRYLNIAHEREQTTNHELSRVQYQLHELSKKEQQWEQKQEELMKKNQSLTLTIAKLSAEISTLTFREEQLIFMLQMKEEELSETTARLIALSTSLRGMDPSKNHSPKLFSKQFQEVAQWKSRFKECESEKTQLKELLEKTQNKNEPEELIHLKEENRRLKKLLLLSGQCESQNKEVTNKESDLEPSELFKLQQACEQLKLNLENTGQTLKQYEEHSSLKGDKSESNEGFVSDHTNHREISVNNVPTVVLINNNDYLSKSSSKVAGCEAGKVWKIIDDLKCERKNGSRLLLAGSNSEETGMFCPTDPLQIVHCPSRLTEDTVSHVLHFTFSHMDKKNGYNVKLLFIEYSLAFSILVPHGLFTKLRDLGLVSCLCAWVFNFLPGKPQVATPNTGAPQGYILRPLLYTFYNHDSVPKHSSNSIVKFADGTVVLIFISNNHKTVYMKEVENMALHCQKKPLKLNISKTKEQVVDFTKRQPKPYTPQNNINGTAVERERSFKYLGIHISENLTWTEHSQSKKPRQRLYHLRQLRKCGVSPVILRSFLIWCCGKCLETEHNILVWELLCPPCTKSVLPPLQGIYPTKCRTRATRIVRNSSHPSNCLSDIMKSGKPFRSFMTKTILSHKTSQPEHVFHNNYRALIELYPSVTHLSL